jgi:hypothetical protein
MKEKEQSMNNQNQPTKNIKDFEDYYQINISINKYIENLSGVLQRYYNLNRSQLIRHLIYTKYQELKPQLKQNPNRTEQSEVSSKSPKE